LIDIGGIANFLSFELPVYTRVAVYKIVERRSTQPHRLDDPKVTDGLELSGVCRCVSSCLEVSATVIDSVPKIVVRDHHHVVQGLVFVVHLFQVQDVLHIGDDAGAGWPAELMCFILVWRADFGVVVEVRMNLTL
jgi:hypothetical protein